MKTIVITSLVDVIGMLSNDSLDKNLYLMDNNRADGSTDQGTDMLKTKVQKGDQIIWTTMSLEPEAYASITGIDINHEYCEPQEQIYQGSDVVYWAGIIKKDISSIPYKIFYNIGTRSENVSTSNSPSFIGDNSK